MHKNRRNIWEINSKINYSVNVIFVNTDNMKNYYPGENQKFLLKLFSMKFIDLVLKKNSINNKNLNSTK